MSEKRGQWIVGAGRPLVKSSVQKTRLKTASAAFLTGDSTNPLPDIRRRPGSGLAEGGIRPHRLLTGPIP